MSRLQDLTDQINDIISFHYPDGKPSEEEAELLSRLTDEANALAQAEGTDDEICYECGAPMGTGPAGPLCGRCGCEAVSS